MYVCTQLLSKYLDIYTYSCGRWSTAVLPYKHVGVSVWLVQWKKVCVAYFLAAFHIAILMQI